jgi:hypothetical protein
MSAWLVVRAILLVAAASLALPGSAGAQTVTSV